MEIFVMVLACAGMVGCGATSGFLAGHRYAIAHLPDTLAEATPEQIRELAALTAAKRAA